MLSLNSSTSSSAWGTLDEVVVLRWGKTGQLQPEWAAGHDFRAVILNVCTGSAMPFRVSSPIGSASTMSSIRLNVF